LRHLVVAPKKPELVPAPTLPVETPLRRAGKITSDSSVEGDLAAVPDFVGLSLREAVEKARGMKVKVKMHGNGYVVNQAPAPGGPWKEDAILVLNLQG
jgi:cell division protein FtsI (penicillin-binding protein 3)